MFIYLFIYLFAFSFLTMAAVGHQSKFKRQCLNKYIIAGWKLHWKF